MQGKESVLGTA